MARQWFAEGVQVHEDSDREYFVGFQFTENQAIAVSAPVTRLGLYGGPRAARQGSFAGKTEAVVSPSMIQNFIHYYRQMRMK